MTEDLLTREEVLEEFGERGVLWQFAMPSTRVNILASLLALYTTQTEVLIRELLHVSDITLHGARATAEEDRKSYSLYAEVDTARSEVEALLRDNDIKKLIPYFHYKDVFDEYNVFIKENDGMEGPLFVRPFVLRKVAASLRDHLDDLEGAFEPEIHNLQIRVGTFSLDIRDSDLYRLVRLTDPYQEKAHNLFKALTDREESLERAELYVKEIIYKYLR